MEKIELGISQAELRKQVVASVVEKVYSSLADGRKIGEDEDGEPRYAERIQEKVIAAVRDRLDKIVQKKVEAAILPLVESKLDKLVIPRTNQYGEPKGEPRTFIEYAIEKAENYMTEQVDFDGKAKGDSWGSWTGKQTRITHMVHQHLHYAIETAMKKALADANSKIVKGIEETCKMQLALISQQLKMDVKTK